MKKLLIALALVFAPTAALADTPPRHSRSIRLASPPNR